MVSIRRSQAGWITRSLAVVFLLVAASASASASPPLQGGGASSTGTIAGRVTDASGLALPGVTISASSPALITPQTASAAATDCTGSRLCLQVSTRWSSNSAGFGTLQREGIQLTLGFTATINAELALASLQESVTVRGDSPVIDLSNTRVQQNFKLQALQEIPNARDMWALLAITPSVQMSRIDVGGSRAGTQTGYAAYGYSGQNRVLVENINVTEGTSGAGTYWDYGSFEEIFFGTIGQGAEMPTPGVQTRSW